MISAVSPASSSGGLGGLRCVQRCWPRTRQARLSGTPSAATTCSTQARRRAGLEVPPGGLGQDHLLQRQIRPRTTHAGVLSLERLQPLHLVALQATILRPPTIV